MVKDMGIKTTPQGKEREVYALDDIRLKTLAAPNQKISGKFRNYKWSETDKLMDLFVFLPVGTAAADVAVDIQRQSLRVSIKGEREAVVLSGALHGRVRASDCWWVLTDEDGKACVHAQLPKMPPDDKLWGDVVAKST